MPDSGAPADAENRFGSIWTRIKLEALEQYLKAFNTALQNKSFARVYIDAFAGTGKCDIRVRETTKSIDGSARRALDVEPPFQEFHFIEFEAKKVAALKELATSHPDKKITITKGDANTSLAALCTTQSWRRKRAVLFLDPFGMEVEWTTLEAIAATKAIDVWYLFPYSGLYRQAARNAGRIDPDKEAALTRNLGTATWRQAFYTPSSQHNLFGDAEADERSADHPEMLEFVSDRLKALFPTVVGPKILYQKGNSKHPSGAPLFALYFAASNPAPAAQKLATRIAKHILDTL